MSKDKFNDSIASLLSEGRINHVINVLRRKCAEGVAAHPDLAALDARLAAVADTYHRMRQFLIGGFPDPERERVLSGVKRELRELGRQYLFVCNENRLDPLFAEYRLQKVRHSDMTAIAEKYRKNLYRLEMAKETESDTEAFLRSGEELVEAAFRRAWAMPPAAADEREAVAGLLRDPDMEFALKSQLISGLLLGALRFNDPGKLELLLAAYEEADDERLEARALTAVVLILARWGNSAVASPAIEGRLSSISDSILTYTRLKDVVMTLIRTRDTDRVSREVTEAFNTTMKELTPEMLEKLQRDGMLADGAEGDINPEWERLMKNKDIEEKMKALNDMQLEGMDVMMQTFSRLKAFPFFRTMANWFLPFSAAHSAVSPLFENFSGEAFASMADATEMCSADR
ncbi:MAG: hypothetical protein J1F07_01960, partial [Muribaculaceae bacterium]|nr:hypothetical protein [Muribaculaceae bacterium]